MVYGMIPCIVIRGISEEMLINFNRTALMVRGGRIMPSHYTNTNKCNYKSQFERGIAANLTKRSIKFEYEPHKITYWLKTRCAKCKNCGSKDVFEKHSYTPDFILSNGIVIEAKGKFTSENRTKMLSVIESNPELDIRMLFMKDNWLTKNHGHRYSDWCEKHGIPYAFLKVPQEWANE
jgi:hypothetical protein